ncbi:hypothetical protein V6Z12_D07G009500 [Gossypium hirsutum]
MNHLLIFFCIRSFFLYFFLLSITLMVGVAFIASFTIFLFSFSAIHCLFPVSCVVSVPFLLCLQVLGRSTKAGKAVLLLHYIDGCCGFYNQLYNIFFFFFFFFFCHALFVSCFLCCFYPFFCFVCRF